MGRNAGSRKVRSPANTRAMKTPSGLVTAKISARNTKICSQPLMVISKFLRTQERVEQVNHRRSADDEHDERLKIHGAFLFHAVAEMHVGDREGKECDRDCSPKNVLHISSPDWNRRRTRECRRFQPSSSPNQNLTRMSKSTKCSSRRRSGNHTVLPCAAQAV